MRYILHNYMIIRELPWLTHESSPSSRNTSTAEQAEMNNSG